MASLLISSSEIEALEGGCDHWLFAGDAFVAAWARLSVLEESDRIVCCRIEERNIVKRDIEFARRAKDDVQTT